MISKYFFSALLSLLFLQSTAQKKVTAVSHSALTGVMLPQGSKQDKRFLMELTAKTTLEIESKKAKITIKATEVLYLPAVVVSGFNADSLVNQLTALGWNIIPVDTDDKYVWLQKDNRSVIAYFSMDKKETQLYFGEAGSQPNLVGETDSKEIIHYNKK